MSGVHEHVLTIFAQWCLERYPSFIVLASSSAAAVVVSGQEDGLDSWSQSVAIGGNVVAGSFCSYPCCLVLVVARVFMFVSCHARNAVKMLETVLLCSRVFLSQLITTLNTDFNKNLQIFNYIKKL